MPMDYYDMVMGSCIVPEGFEQMLGFRRVFVSGTDFELVDADKNHETKGKIATGSTKGLMRASKLFAGAVIPTSLELDRALIEALKDNGTALLIPFGIVCIGSDFTMSKNMHLAGKLFTYARKKRVRVGFITLARSSAYLESYIQLIELAKLIGATEGEARQGVSLVGELVGIKR